MNVLYYNPGRSLPGKRLLTAMKSDGLGAVLVSYPISMPILITSEKRCRLLAPVRMHLAKMMAVKVINMRHRLS
jgi:hypothetical protein